MFINQILTLTGSPTKDCPACPICSPAGSWHPGDTFRGLGFGNWQQATGGAGYMGGAQTAYATSTPPAP